MSVQREPRMDICSDSNNKSYRVRDLGKESLPWQSSGHARLFTCSVAGVVACEFARRETASAQS